ncbi:MAG TPA: DNA topoisomerase IB [Pseudonocardiaceae bacterium]|nr:DNA topoisomerase IB [Pseudonocardiaceae bacterium]
MRLRRSLVAKPGWTRRRTGRGFRYLDENGRALDGEQVERIKALVIPPAWRDVWICPWPNGHIQAVGVDDAGRKQYLYHDEWRRQRDAEKFDRVLELAPALPAFRKAVAEDLRGRGFSCSRTLAVSLRMLDQGVFRTGGEEYVEQNGSYGVATLLREHVTVRGERVSFDYRAKGGVQRTLTLTDPLLAKAVAGLRRTRSGSDRLLVYRTGRTWREVRADDVNARFQELVGGDFTVKDLRTWNATVLAAAALAGSARTRRAVTQMYREVAEHLGNTPAVVRKSYVDPRLVDLFERGVTIGPALDELGSADLSRTRVRESVERAVHGLLTDA